MTLQYLENASQDGTLKVATLKEIELNRIGDVQIWVRGKHGPDSKFGGDWYSSGVEVGLDEVSQRFIPVKIETLQDLVDGYDEMMAIVEKWPRMPGERHFIDRQNRELAFYVAERNDAPASERNKTFAENDR